MDSDQQTKLARARNYLRQAGYTGMVLARQDTFNWVTSGGNSRVIVPDSAGVGVVVITLDHVYMVAQLMDGARIMDEEMTGLEAEYAPLHWYEESALDRALTLAGSRPVCDVFHQDGDCRLKDIYSLQFPLTNNEIKRLEYLGAMSDKILTNVAGKIEPGIVDYEVEAMLLYEYAKYNIQCDVLLIGTDERIFKYRHPTPSGAILGKYVLLHTAARQGGLHCNVTRSLYFGDSLPENIRKAYDAVSAIEANCMSRCVNGTRWADIFQEHKDLLIEYEFSEDWRGHYPGGRTGYFVCQPDLSMDPANVILESETYDWFITVAGAKVEELGLNCNREFRILSHTGLWPSKDFTANGKTFSLPQIMLR